MEGDASDAASVRGAVEEQDAVLSAIGDSNPIQTSTLVSDATRLTSD